MRIKKRMAMNKEELEKNIHHGTHNRTRAIVYIDGDIYEGVIHALCLDKWRDEKNTNNYNILHSEQLEEYVKVEEETLPIAFGAKVESGTQDYTGVDKAIYIDTGTVFNTTLEEVVVAIKQKYPDYKIYSDNEYEIDLENNKVKYKRLARLIKK